MERTLVKFHQEAAEKSILTLQNCSQQLQGVHAEFCALINGKSATLTAEELKSLFAESFGIQGFLKPNIDQIRNLIIEKHFPGGTLNGLPVNTDLVLIPSIESLVSAITRTPVQALTFLATGLIIIPQGKKVVIAEEAEEQIRESFSTYAETESEKERFQAAKGLADALNHLCSLLPEKPLFKVKIELSPELETVLDSDENGNFFPHEYFVKTGTVAEAGSGFNFQPVINPGSQTKNQESDYIDDMLNEVEPLEKQDSGLDLADVLK